MPSTFNYLLSIPTLGRSRERERGGAAADCRMPLAGTGSRKASQTGLSELAFSYNSTARQHGNAASDQGALLPPGVQGDPRSPIAANCCSREIIVDMDGTRGRRETHCERLVVCDAKWSAGTKASLEMPYAVRKSDLELNHLHLGSSHDNTFPYFPR